MITGADISNGIGGAFAMARNDERWADNMAMGAEDVFRSFWAVPLALPAVLLGTEAQRRLALANPLDQVAVAMSSIPTGTLFLSQVLTFLLVWAAEIALLTSIAQRRNAGWKVSPLIIGANWSKFLFLVLSGLLSSASIMAGAPALASLGGMAAYGLLFFLRWGIIRRTLETSPMGTVGMLALLTLAFIAVSFVVTAFLALFGLVDLSPRGV